MSSPELLIPDTEPEKSSLSKSAVPRRNLAENSQLCERVRNHLEAYFSQHKIKREPYEEIWDLSDEMYKAGQNETRRESERTRLDRQGDNRTKTKSQRNGSTLYYRTIRTLSALFADMLFSDKDPYKFTPRTNEQVFHSDQQADDLAHQHNLLMRYSRDQECFDTKSIDLLTALCKYGSVPIYSRWNRTVKRVLDRWPVYGRGEAEIEGEVVQGTTVKTKISRREVVVDNRPEVCHISPVSFYADPDIADIQMQQAIFVVSDASIVDIRANGRMGVYENIKEVTSMHLRDGEEDNDLDKNRELNSGLDTSTERMNTGVFRQVDCHALLPIDESKPEDEMWNAEEHEPVRYWVTIIGNDIERGVCVRLERNPDPDDEYPFEMINLIPDDADKLYHVTLCQLLRSNYTETVISRQQSIDSKTLQNNRPLKAVKGEVHLRTGETLKYDKDSVIWVDNEKSVTEFQHSTPIDNERILALLEQDSNDAAGTGPTIRGIPMGGRTSSSEAVNAQEAAQLPHKMLAKYIFEKWLKFHARKGIRQWHLYADNTQILKIIDEGSIQREVRPTKLFGDFDIQITLVDDYERDIMTQQSMLFAAQNLLPLFAQYLDMRQVAKVFMEKMTKVDVSEFILPDRRDAERLKAKQENALFATGQYVAPALDEDHEGHLIEHRGARVALSGLEDEPAYADMAQDLDRHIAAHEELAKQAGPQQAGIPGMGAEGPGGPRPGAPLEAPPANETPGEAVGNQALAAPAGILGAV